MTKRENRKGWLTVAAIILVLGLVGHIEQAPAQQPAVCTVPSSEAEKQEEKIWI